MDIKIKLVTGNGLYLKYPVETSPQPCFVELDARTGALSASANAIIGSGQPMDVFNGHALRWKIPALRTEIANALLAEIAPLAERIVRGYESRWNGQSTVGHYSEDATAAIEEVERACDCFEDDAAARIVIWQAPAWFGVLGSESAQASELGIVSSTTDEQLETIAASEIAKADEVDDIEGIVDYLKGLRDATREAA